MFKYIRQKIGGTDGQAEERLEDFVDWEKSNRYGFPYEASTMSVDTQLGLVALGTKQGDVIVSGYPGIVWSASILGKRGPDREIMHLYFINGTGFLVAICRDGKFVRFKLDGCTMEHDASSYDKRMKTASSCHFTRIFREPTLLIGTVAGSIYYLHVESLEVQELLSYDAYRKELELSDETKLVLNKATDITNIVSITKEREMILFVIANAVVVIYSNHVEQHYTISPAINDLEYDSSASQVIMAHSNGQISTWDFSRASDHKPQLIRKQCIELFGPFPCDPITRIKTFYTMGKDEGIPLVAYMGGMERATFNDRNTVTVRHGSKTVVYEFPSRVIDFASIPDPNGQPGVRANECLLVMTENELCAIDFKNDEWKPLNPRTFFALNASFVTSQVYACVDEHIWRIFNNLRTEYFKDKNFSEKDWPLACGKAILEQLHSEYRKSDHNVLITGHANGNVCFWDSSHYKMELMFIIKSAAEFAGFTEDRGNLAQRNDQDSQVPFIQIGEYDPFCDDDRLSITALHFDNKSGTLSLNNRGGAVVVYSLYDKEAELKMMPMRIAWKSEGAVDKKKVSAMPLAPRKEQLRYKPGYQPYHHIDKDAVLLQFSPPVSLSALTCHPPLNVIIAGNEHGYAIVDYRAKQVIENVCIATNEEMSRVEGADSALSRFRTMKKSIRQTFRRKKRSAENTVDEAEEEIVKPVERRIEARAVTEPMPPWQIRCIRMLRMPTANAACMDDVAAIATNGGRIIFYKIYSQALYQTGVAVTKYRELKLAHGAPIVHIDVSCEAGNDPAPHMRLVVFTEEQIKTFSLPDLHVTRIKYKLTSHEGARIKRAGIVKLQSKRDEAVHNLFACVVTNIGTVNIHSLTNPKKKIERPVFRSTDIAGINSTIITQDGGIFYLLPGGSEVQTEAISRHSRPWVNPFAIIVSKDHYDEI